MDWEDFYHISKQTVQRYLISIVTVLIIVDGYYLCKNPTGLVIDVTFISMAALIMCYLGLIYGEL